MQVPQCLFFGSDGLLSSILLLPEGRKACAGMDKPSLGWFELYCSNDGHVQYQKGLHASLLITVAGYFMP